MIGWIALGDIITLVCFGVLVLCGVISVAMDAGDHDEDGRISDDGANVSSSIIGGDGTINQYNDFLKGTGIRKAGKPRAR